MGEARTDDVFKFKNLFKNSAIISNSIAKRQSKPVAIARKEGRRKSSLSTSNFTKSASSTYDRRALSLESFVCRHSSISAETECRIFHERKVKTEDPLSFMKEESRARLYFAKISNIFFSKCLVTKLCRYEAELNLYRGHIEERSPFRDFSKAK